MSLPINPFSPEALHDAALGPFARPRLQQAMDLGIGTAADPGDQTLNRALGLRPDQVRALSQVDPRLPEFLGAPEAQRLQEYLSQGDGDRDSLRHLLGEVLDGYQRQPPAVAAAPKTPPARAWRTPQAAPGYGEGVAPSVPDTGPWWLESRN